MEKLSERLTLLIKEIKINDAEFSRLTGITKANISKYKSESNPYLPGYETLCKILEAFPNLDARWLLTGNGLMWNIQAELNNIDEPIENYTIKNKNPLIGDDLLNQVSTIKKESTMETEIIGRLIGLLERQGQDIRYALETQRILTNKLPNLGEHSKSRVQTR